MNKEVLGSSGRDWAISVVRFLAFVSIVVCHIFQYFDHYLANWFNVGVQIFLCISGYLYGQKIITSPAKFYKKQFLKILIPYWIVLISYMFIYLCFLGGKIPGGITTAIRTFFAGTTLPGGTHLWFVGTILVCYILTPLISQIFSGFSTKSKKFVRSTIALSVITFIIFWSLFPGFPSPSWIVCYVLGYAIGYALHHQIIPIEAFTRIFGILASQNISQIILENCFELNFWGISEEAYNSWRSLNHIWLGIFIFLVLKQLFSKINFKKHRWLIKICKISDSCSYEAYLVHQFVILGRLSLVGFTPFIPLNITVITIIIVGLTAAVKIIEKPFLILVKLKKRRAKLV